MEYVFGFSIAVVVSVMASLVGLDKERGFYPVVLIVIASYYVLFAVMGASASAIAIELAQLVVFVLIALIGFKRSPWVIVVGLAAHGVFDLFHPHIATNPGVPMWWSGFCLAYDITAAAYLAWLLYKRQANNTDPSTVATVSTNRLG